MLGKMPAMNRRALYFYSLALLLPRIATGQGTKLESYLLLPEPKVMRGKASITPAGAERTVFSPAHVTTTAPGIAVYSSEAFTRLGISPETFAERAAAVADQRLATLQPEFIKDNDGKTRYAVYRGESPLMATLLVAPSLGKIFESIFGEELWLAAPDRHALYVFPAKPEALAEFAEDLHERYESSLYGASCEVFSLKKGRQGVHVVASFCE
jgi:hypothetical protein